MDTFDFPYHMVQAPQEPNNGFQLQFGNGYTFTAAPDAPDQRVFTLYFTGFQYYVGQDGTVDGTVNAAINNFHALYLFYKAHRLNVSFTYPHVVFGDLTVRFKDPFTGPKPIPGGYGILEDFQMTLVEQP